MRHPHPDFSSPRIENNPTDANEARVDAAIAEYLQAVETGNTPSLPEFLKRHEGLADDLREFLTDQAAFQRLAAPLTTSAPGIPTEIKSTTPELLPRTFGGFELQRVIGHGGMGIVYAARRLADERSVALKLLHPWLTLDATAVLRFEREAAAAASLQHPHIVPVLEAGSVDGVPFMVMPLIDGESLDQIIRRMASRLTRSVSEGEGERFTALHHEGSRVSVRPRSRFGLVSSGSPPVAPTDTMPTGIPAIIGLTTPARLAHQLADVADALDHAHQRGVIHRDIKPSNLLLTDDGRLLVTDFGLAHVVQQPSLTRTGEAVGSPAYMSPEQLASRGASIPVDRRTDVYSLGATLYELLTGRRPFVGDSREQLLASIQHDDPLPPRRLCPDLPIDLETICLKALEKEPRRRYATAADMAADLRRAAIREPIRARRPSPLARAGRWTLPRRVSLRWLIALTACGVLALGLSMAFWRSRQEAVSARRQQAVDSALVVALTGDLKATEHAIADAERAGVSADWLHMLRGQVAFHRGEYSAAIEHLHLAASTRKPTVAATAMLATAHLAAGSWEDYETLMNEIESRTPITAEDYLFKGEAEVYFDPRLAVRCLDDAIRRRDTPLARLVRAAARTNLAFDTNDLPIAESALRDAAIARDLLPDHPAALLESLNTHIVAAELWSDSGQLDRHDAELSAAERDYESLNPFGHLPTVIHNRSLFLIQTGRDEAACELLRKSKSQYDAPLVAYDFALALYRRGETQSALRVMESRAAGGDSRLSADESFLRVLLWRENGEADRALATYDDLARRYQSGVTAIFRPCLRLLLGQPDSAISESAHLRTTGRRSPLRGAFYDRLLAFNASQLSEAELCDAVAGSRWDQCEAYFFMGLWHLARGDREQARYHFERCVATRCAGFLSWDWSHALLRRIAADPEWPKWIRRG